MNVGKCSNNSSNSFRLGTFVEAVDGGCALGVESSPQIMKVSPMPWNWMLSTPEDLIAYGAEGIVATERVEVGLEDEPFSMSVFIFLAKEWLISIASNSLFCCLSRKPTHKVTVIYFSSSSVSRTMRWTTCSDISLCLVPSASSALSRTTTNTRAYCSARARSQREEDVGA